jgi:hypothetical protein
VLSPSRVLKHSLDLKFKLQSLLLIVPTATTAPQHHRSAQLGSPPLSLLPVPHLLQVHPHVRRCQIFCSVSELAHAQLSTDYCDLGVEAYSEYCTELRQALAAARAQAGLPMPREDMLQLSVRHLPLHIAALDTATFVLPAAGAPATKAA